MLLRLSVRRISVKMISRECFDGFTQMLKLGQEDELFNIGGL